MQARRLPSRARVVEAFGDAMRRFVQPESVRCSAASSARRRRRCGARGKESLERKALAGSPDAHSAAIAAFGPGTGETVMPASTATRQTGSRGRSRAVPASDERDALAAAQTRDELADARALVVLVQGD